MKELLELSACIALEFCSAVCHQCKLLACELRYAKALLRNLHQQLKLLVTPDDSLVF